MKSYKIIYRDNNLLVVDKPQGLATTPGSLDSLCEALFADFPAIREVRGYRDGEGGLLNRLDNETGGLVLFALSDASFRYYSELMQRGEVKKYYKALVEGGPSVKKGKVTVPIAHHHKSKKRMAAVTEGERYRSKARAAETSWQLLWTRDGRSLLNVLIIKGCRHQIRVHLAYMGLPIVGDKLYSKSKTSVPEYHQLYAYRVVFTNMDGRLTDISIAVPF